MQAEYYLTNIKHQKLQMNLTTVNLNFMTKMKTL